jgi:hypothetical protein
LSAALNEVLQAINDPQISESGGGHNNKGIEYQKNWAIAKMIELREAGVSDFLFLFEAVQDVAVLDSATSPSKIEIYQVKKKDRDEWSWGSLTSLHKPPDPTAQTKAGKPKRSTVKAKPLEGLADSPIGKLFGAIAVFNNLSASGAFVSNAGCNIDLDGGGNAATSLPVGLSNISPHYRDLLQSSLSKIKGIAVPADELAKVRLEKAELAVEDPQGHAIGITVKYLTKASPAHAGQASSFVTSLLSKIGPLCAKTAKAQTLEKMATRHGFSYQEFNAALGDLQQLPDVDFFLKLWLNQLSTESFDFMEISRITLECAAIQRRVLMGTQLPDEPGIKSACDAWLDANAVTSPLKAFLESGREHLKASFPRIKDTELRAHILLRAIPKCVVQN